MRYALEKQIARSTLISQSSESTGSHLKIIEFVDVFVTKSIEGQVAALVAGTALSMYFEQFEGFEVIVHPVNQSGASSNEIADIDIKQNGKIFVAIEVKDKQFSEQDVDHAAFKVSQYGLKSITFIIGINGTDQNPAEELVEMAVSRQDIVLGLQPPYKRPYTAYGVA